MSTPLLVLVGPPASGKTTVGTAVGRDRSASPFRDTDADIEDAAGTSVADIFVATGEAALPGPRGAGRRPSPWRSTTASWRSAAVR